MMNHTVGSFVSADGCKIHTENWLPEGAPKAIVLLVHGLAEHIGRYGHVADSLVGHGYAIYGLDQRAHGQSDGQPRAFIDDYERPLADLKQYCDQISAEHPDVKLFMYGHSLGSFISTLFVLRHASHLAGFISSGSLLLVDTTVPKIVLQIGNLLDKFAPKLPLIPLEADGVSRDPAVVAAYRADPLNTIGRVRVRTAATLNRQVALARERLHEIRLPLLILHGADDPIVPPGGSELLYERAASEDKTLKIYPGLYHEIHNEPEQATVLADVAGWLDGH